MSKEIVLRAQREVEGYHQLGEIVREDIEIKKWEQNKAGRVLQGLAKGAYSSL